MTGVQTCALSICFPVTILVVDEDGKKYALSWESDGESLTGVEYTELDNGVKMRQPRSLIDIATSGISISDLRNVNAYQKFLELNMRKGYLIVILSKDVLM